MRAYLAIDICCAGDISASLVVKLAAISDAFLRCGVNLSKSFVPIGSKATSIWCLITAILPANRKYIGDYVWNASSSKDAEGRRNGNKKKPIDDQIIKEGALPQIIEPELFWEVNNKEWAKA